MSDDDADGVRAERNQLFAKRLGRNKVWSLDEPAVREILFDPMALRLLDAIRRSPDPIPHAALFDAEVAPPTEVTTRLQRLESIGMIRFDRAAGVSGFTAVDRIIAVYCGDSPESKAHYDRRRTTIDTGRW